MQKYGEEEQEETLGDEELDQEGKALVGRARQAKLLPQSSEASSQVTEAWSDSLPSVKADMPNDQESGKPLSVDSCLSKITPSVPTECRNCEKIAQLERTR